MVENQGNPPANEGARTKDGEILRARKITIPPSVENLKTKALDIDTYKNTLLKNKKRTAIFGGGGIFILFVLFVLFASNQRYEGTMVYGACKMFLELYVQYPQYLRMTEAEEFQTNETVSARIWFTQLDGFGQYRMEPIQCYFKEDPEKGYYLDRVTISRQDVDKQKVEAFNNILPALQAMQIDLTYPPPYASNVAGLKFDTDSFRKPIF